MKTEIAAIVGSLAALGSCGPLHGAHGHGHGHEAFHAKREVPQELSHKAFQVVVQEFLQLNNPLGIVDPVFGLLGNKAAAEGGGKVTNLDCLQQETADQAFTNAKAMGDVRGMASALLYRAVERNTGSVGLTSVICNQTAVNPEIAALTQHQDPASTNAAEVNKGIAIVLAQQLALIGVDPLVALEAGTFAPGQIGDPTAKGNSCDTDDCIFSERLLVLDATTDEILAAVAGLTATFTGTGVIQATNIDFNGLSVAEATGVITPAGAGVAAATVDCGALVATPTSSCTVFTTTVEASAAASVQAAMPAATIGVSAVGVNVQVFTGDLGGLPDPVIQGSGDRPFSVAGDTFVNSGAALARSCDRQKNKCANAANSGALAGGVGQCEQQQQDCRAANGLKKRGLRVRSTRTSLNTNGNKDALSRRAVSFGSCSNPTIVFKEGLDGRNTAAFIAENQGDFNHGSALNIKVIADFICQRLGSSCKADASVVDLCNSASAAAVASTQDQSAADAFNSILIGGSGAGIADFSAEVLPKATPAPVAAADSGFVVMTITSCV